MRQAPSQAKDNPVIPQFVQPELSNTELPTRSLDPIEDGEREQDILIAEADAAGEYAAQLAFNEEWLTILIHRAASENPPTAYSAGVNGQILWFPVDTPVRAKRKFVEVLARSQPMRVTTESGEDPSDQLTFNRTNRRLSSSVSFTVLEDKNPKGREWLARVMREG